MKLPKRSSHTSAAIAALLATLSVSGNAAAVPRYALEHIVTLGGEGGWDYMAFEQGGHRLFIAHGSRVEVIDTRTLRRVGEVADTPGVHGIALAPELGRGYISAGASGSVVVFDLGSLARLAEIKVTGENPDAILYDSATRRVFTFNGHGRNATVIDAVKGEVIATLALDAKPEFAQADGRGHVYVNLEDKSSLAAIDSRALSVQSVWPISGCEQPSGLALDAAARQLFSVCDNRIMAVMDADSGRVLGTAPIGEGADAAAFDAATRLAFASCGEGLLTVVQRDASGRPGVVQSVPTQKGARTMALDQRSHRIYLVTASYGTAPEPTAEHPHPRAPILPGTFRLLVIQRLTR